MEINNFREFEALSVGNYVRYDDKYWKITKIYETSNPKDITVNLENLDGKDVPKSDLKYIRLTENYLVTENDLQSKKIGFGFYTEETEHENELLSKQGFKGTTIFRKIDGSLILADYTKTGKYCIYEPLVGDRVREENAKEMLSASN